MHAAIPLSQARKVARMGDLAAVRAMGQEHRKRETAWEERSLRRILASHGQTGIVAAMGADTPAQAAAWIATPLPGLQPYRQKTMLGFWLKPEMEILWEAICQAKPRWDVGVNTQGSALWDTVLGVKGVSRRSMHALASHHEAPSTRFPEVLWAAIEKHPDTWQSFLAVFGHEYFVENGGSVEHAGQTLTSSPLYTLFKFSVLMPRGRLFSLLESMEQDGGVFPKMLEQRGTLAFGALCGRNTTLLKRVKSWNSQPLLLPGGCALLAASMLDADALHGKWSERLPCLKLLGSLSRPAMQRSLQDPGAIEGLLDLASGGHADHVAEVLQSALAVGVDLLLLHDRHGQDIVSALRGRCDTRLASVIAHADRHVLETRTAGAPETRTPRRI